MSTCYEIAAGGVRTWHDMGMRIGRDWKDELPDPVTHEVSVPGAPGGTLDLTEALTGDVSYKGRKQTCTLYLDCDEENIKDAMSRLTNAWHGRRLHYSLGWDQGFTYAGRFSLSWDHYAWGRAKCKLTIDADAFKVKENNVYKLNAAAGRLCYFVCGRVPTHPTIECKAPTVVVWQGRRTMLGVGTWRLRNVLFTQGVNEIWLDSSPVVTTLWTDLAGGGRHAMTWKEAAQFRWAEVAAVDYTGTARPNRSWADLSQSTWSALATAKTRWTDLDFRPVAQDPYVYVKYDYREL